MTFGAAALGPSTRNEALKSMAAGELDVLVIGGGVVGAGVALDATTRGLKVGLLEARDHGSGTSSRSSKLIHGGLGYLKHLNFRLVSEALRERELILPTPCPHPTKPVPFIAAEIDSQQQPDDHTADSVRLGAPGVRHGAR